VSKSQYPSPEQLHVPDNDDASPDQHFYVGWLVQHNRLWLLCAALAALNVFQACANIGLAKKPRPIQYVTLDGGGISVVATAEGKVLVDDRVYAPERLRAVVFGFIENRYAYDWENPNKLRTAFNYLSPTAVASENDKLRVLNYQANVFQNHVKASVTPDYAKMKVTAQKGGFFVVEVPVKILYTDALTHPSSAPLIKENTIILTVQQVAPSDLNPLGYSITVTPDKDVVL
jgi:hypothetical protein